jgi:hypothetical protein
MSIQSDDWEEVAQKQHETGELTPYMLAQLKKELTQAKKEATKEKKADRRDYDAARKRKKWAEKKTKKESLKAIQTIAAVAENKTALVADNEVFESLKEDYQDILATKQIGWQPFPGPQTHFLEADEFEVLFSGGRAPGKSDALMMDALRYCGYREFRGLVIRKAMKELRDLIKRAKELYPLCYPGTKWKEQEKLFVFPSGATVEFGYCDHEDDVDQYKGQEYSWLGIDELTEIAKEETYEKLIMSVRKRGAQFKTYVRATTNPNGPGKNWVKKRFVDKGPMNATISLESYIPRLDRTIKTTRKWIHGTVFDNPKIIAENPEYVAMLQTIDNQILRAQWLEGDWDSADGLAFDEFDRKVHVIEPFQLPDSWYRFRAADWGFKTKAACLWFAINPEGTIYVYREFIAGGQTPRGAMHAKDFGAALKAIEDSLGEKVRYGILDASAWARRGEDAPPPAEDMAGLTWRPSDRTKNSRLTGKLQVHKYLQKDADGIPGVYIFNTCTDLISCLTSLQADKDNPEDVDTDGDDHSYDAFRYGLMSRPKVYNNYNWSNQQSETPIVSNITFGY